MKYKVTFFVIVIIASIFSFFCNGYVKSLEKNRVDQHLDYKVNNTCDGSSFCTHLPIISIDTHGQEIPMPIKSEIKEEKENVSIVGSFSLKFNANESTYLTDEDTISSSAVIKYRGKSSRYYPKHQYSISFIDGKGNNKDISLLGMKKENKWVLNGPYLDKTLIRNYLAYNISGKFRDDVPEVRFCEVFVNGKYQGVYLLTESISRSLTQITRFKPKWTNISSYLIRYDRYDENKHNIDNFTKYTGKLVPGNVINVIYPPTDKLSSDILKYITDDFSSFEKALYSYDYKEYSKYIDVDSFVDYFIINEFFKNNDAGTHSTYFYKDVRGKIHIGPIWDFNNSLDNYVAEISSIDGFMFQNKTWYNILLKDEKFVNKVIKRYKALRKSYLDYQYLENYIDGAIEYLGDSIDRNYEVWGYTFTKLPVDGMLFPYERNYTSYEEAVTQMKTFIKKRGEWLDENIETLKQYCHRSVIKSYEGE